MEYRAEAAKISYILFQFHGLLDREQFMRLDYRPFSVKSYDITKKGHL